MSTEELIRSNLTEVSGALRLYLNADREDSQLMETQLQQLARVEGVVNLARPFMKTYAHHVQTNPALRSCLLQTLQCHPDQEALQSSCQAVVTEYINLMAALQSFVSKQGAWTANIQNKFVEVYEFVNNSQFATLLQLLDVCQNKPAQVCTPNVNAIVDRLLLSNVQLVAHSTEFIHLLQQNVSPPSVVTTLFDKFYQWNSNVFFYIVAHVLAPLVGLASGVDWRNPQRAKWYTLIYASVKGVVDTFANSHVAHLFVELFKPPEMRIHFTFDFFNPFAFSQTQKGYMLYYLDYLYKWNESLSRLVQHQYVMPLLERALTQMLGAARSKYVPGFLKSTLGPVVDYLGKLYIPDIANSLAYLVVTILLPMLLPYMMYYANVGMNKLFNMLARQVMKYNRHMKHVLSTLPPSANASVKREDVQTLKFLDEVVEMNKGSWSYRTFKWFIGVLRKDAQTSRKARVVAYKCVRPQRHCLPVLDSDQLDGAALYFPSAKRCQLRC